MSSGLCAAILAVVLSGGEPDAHKVDFKARLGRYEGCFVIKEIGRNWTFRHSPSRCAERFSPCSTFKIFNSLAGLECGVVTGPDMVLKWDGKPQWNKAWEHDHTLASAVKESVVWYFQEVARRIGPERMNKYLAACDYGNQDTSGGIDKFWLSSTLKISPDEQIRFMEDLYTDHLPFRKDVMATVRKLLVFKQGGDWVFSGKTGTAATNDKPVMGWFVGHVRSADRQFVFAINIHAEDKVWGSTARDLAFEILKDLGLVDDSPPVSDAAQHG